VNTTPTTVMILANHPINLLLFLKNFIFSYTWQIQNLPWLT
jgi:hypothetical protein